MYLNQCDHCERGVTLFVTPTQEYWNHQGSKPEDGHAAACSQPVAILTGNEKSDPQPEADVAEQAAIPA